MESNVDDGNKEMVKNCAGDHTKTFCPLSRFNKSLTDSELRGGGGKVGQDEGGCLTGTTAAAQLQPTAVLGWPAEISEDQ